MVALPATDATDSCTSHDRVTDMPASNTFAKLDNFPGDLVSERERQLPEHLLEWTNP